MDGVVVHASGTWKGTATGKKGHHQAIVFMHGTQDPAMPYDEMIGAFEQALTDGYEAFDEINKTNANL